jgi:hypothetical protein
LSQRGLVSAVCRANTTRIWVQQTCRWLTNDEIAARRG